MSAGVAPAWVTVTVWPATVRVPTRELVAEFAVTEYATTPLPFPVEPDVIVIQLALLVACHEQPEAAVIWMVPVPAGAATDMVAGDIEYVQLPPACVRVKV